MARSRKYGPAAEAKHAELNKLKHQAWTEKMKIVGVILVGAIADLMMFLRPMSAANYEDDPIVTYALSFLCAVAPVVLASLVAALSYTKDADKDKPKAGRYLFAGVLGVGTVAFLIGGWILRDKYYDDASGITFLLNLLAVTIAIGVFVYDRFFHQVRKAKLEKEIAIAEQTFRYLNSLDALSNYSSTEDNDKQRRKSDDTAYCQAGRGVATKGLELMQLVRMAVAKRVAKDAEAMKHIVEETSIQLGQKDVTAETSDELFKAVCKGIGVPDEQAVSDEWTGSPSNNHEFDDRIKGKADTYDKQLKKLLGGEEEGLEEEDSDETSFTFDDPIFVDAEVVA